MRLLSLLTIFLIVGIVFSSAPAQGFLNEIGQTVEGGKSIWASIKDFFKFEWVMGGKTVEAKDCVSADCYEEALSKEYKGSEVRCTLDDVEATLVGSLAEKRIYLTSEEGVLEYCTVKKSESSVIGFCCRVNECKKDGKDLAKTVPEALKANNPYVLCRTFDESDCFKCSAKV